MYKRQVNNKGKIQSSKSDNKKYDIENRGIAAEDVNVTFTGKKVKEVKVEGQPVMTCLLYTS